MRVLRRLGRCSILLLATCVVCGIAQASVSVRELGAKGDGKTDDTAAFRKAFAKSNDVYVPAGRYLIGPIRMPDKSGIHGDGPASVIVQRTNDMGVLISAGSGCSIRDVAITGGQAAVKQTPEEEPCLIGINGKTSVTVRGVLLTDYAHTGVGCWGGADLTISNNTLRNLNEAIRLRNCKRAKVNDNSITDMKFHGIEFWGITSRDYKDKDFRTKDSADLIFRGNYVKDGGGGAIWGSGAVRVIMANNIIDGARDVGLDLEWCDDSVIVGNTVRNCANAGISLFAACRRVSITGNTILNDGPIGDPNADWWVRSGIWLTGPNRGASKSDLGHRDISIVGNTIMCSEGERRGMWIGVESDNITIADNTIRGGSSGHGGTRTAQPVLLRNLTGYANIGE